MEGKCQNCHEKDCELEEIETEKGKKMWCDACIEGYKIKKPPLIILKNL